MIKKGQIYHHFKGGKYKIEDLAYSAETTEQCVVYKSFANKEKWVRTLENFTETITLKNEDGTEFLTKRFTLIED